MRFHFSMEYFGHSYNQTAVPSELATFYTPATIRQAKVLVIP